MNTNLLTYLLSSWLDVLSLLVVLQLKVRDVLEKYDEVIHGDKIESFQLGIHVLFRCFDEKHNHIHVLNSFMHCVL